MAAAFPAMGIEFMNPDDDYVRIPCSIPMLKAIRSIWDIVAVLFLIGAALGAFNLAGRIVESQRRQIGIGMALGLPRRWIAFRPMLVGLQIALLGTLLGLIAGYGLGQLFANLFRTCCRCPIGRFRCMCRVLSGPRCWGLCCRWSPR